jgi:hypothetical protein
MSARTSRSSAVCEGAVFGAEESNEYVSECSTGRNRSEQANAETARVDKGLIAGMAEIIDDGFRRIFT